MKKIILQTVLLCVGFIISAIMSTTAIAAKYSPSCSSYWKFSSASQTCSVEKFMSSGGSGPACTLINVSCRKNVGGTVVTPKYPATGSGIYYPALQNLVNCNGQLNSFSCESN